MHAGRRGGRGGHRIFGCTAGRLGNLAVILLDAHVLVWMVAGEDRLSRHAKSAIQRARLSDGLGIADVTIWELAFLIARGALRTHSTIENTVRNFVTRS